MSYGRLSPAIDPRAPDFSLHEVSRTGQNLSNQPDAASLEAARLLAVEVLQPIRNQVGPLGVNSWYRSPAVNAAVGGVPNSIHRSGGAADVDHARLTGRELATLLWTRQDLPLGEVIWYTHKGHVHISRDPQKSRQFLRGSPSGEVAWRPEPGEVNAVLAKIAGHASDAGSHAATHPAQEHIARAQGDGGGAMLGVIAALGIGAAVASRRYGPVGGPKKKPRKVRSKR